VVDTSEAVNWHHDAHTGRYTILEYIEDTLTFPEIIWRPRKRRSMKAGKAGEKRENRSGARKTETEKLR